MRHSFRLCLALLSASVLVLALSSTALAAGGVQKRTYKVGPFKLIPGQNEIQNTVIRDKPQVDGYITRIRPDLTYVGKNGRIGKIPGVDVIHLHHGVWLNLGASDATWPGLPERFFAAGEEKTHMRLPKGYGYPNKGTDRWILNHMIHNLTPVPTSVYMVYEIDFIPKTSPAARGIRPVRPIWSDVMNGSMYPVFDVEKGAGKRGRYVFPDHAKNPYGKNRSRRVQGRRNEWVVDRNGVLVATAGHLHPGGLHTDLWLSRKGARVRKASCASASSATARKRCLAKAPRGKGSKAHLFRSDARYYEPAGAVSWDVTMGATRANWRVKVRKGDVLSTSATYNTKRAEHVRQVRDAAAGMLERADAIERDLGSLVAQLAEGLRAGAASLSAAVGQLPTSVPRPAAVRAETPPPADTGPDVPPPDVELEPERDEGQDSIAEPDDAAQPEQLAERDQLAEPVQAAELDQPAEPGDLVESGQLAERDHFVERDHFAEPDEAAADAGAAEAPRGATTGANGQADRANGSEGARLIALNMALNGTPREETAGYLRENFELDDPEQLLDDVYARAGR
ncbi:MAG TPA: hypothetical protein VEQ61_10975 [Thermoleophilaceae bacterium]|nr:hypothetical protein [Thermoleophilaceae bacterium]